MVDRADQAGVDAAWLDGVVTKQERRGVDVHLVSLLDAVASKAVDLANERGVDGAVFATWVDVAIGERFAEVANRSTEPPGCRLNTAREGHCPILSREGAIPGMVSSS